MFASQNLHKHAFLYALMQKSKTHLNGYYDKISCQDADNKSFTPYAVHKGTEIDAAAHYFCKFAINDLF